MFYVIYTVWYGSEQKIFPSRDDYPLHSEVEGEGESKRALGEQSKQHRAFGFAQLLAITQCTVDRRFSRSAYEYVKASDDDAAWMARNRR